VPPLLIPQMPVIMECLEAVGIDAFGAGRIRAEDIIASLVTRVKHLSRSTAGIETCSASSGTVR